MRVLARDSGVVDAVKHCSDRVAVGAVDVDHVGCRARARGPVRAAGALCKARVEVGVTVVAADGVDDPGTCTDWPGSLGSGDDVTRPVNIVRACP